MRNSVVFKNARFTFFSECSFKAEFAPDGNFINRELFITEINGVKFVSPQVRINRGVLNIRTKKLRITYDSKQKGFNKRNLKVSYKLNELTKQWRYGMKDLKNLGGTMLQLFKYPECTKPESLSRGVLSRNGFYAYYDNTHTFRSQTGNWAEVDLRKGYSIFFFIGYGQDFKTGLKEFSKIFGRGPLIPKWAFGFWYSRWHPYKQDEFVNIVKKYRSFDIPIDVMVVDTDWRRLGWAGYEISKKYFYDFRGFVRRMHRMGIKLALNDHPGYNESEPLPESDVHHGKIGKYLGRKISGDWRCNWADRKEVEAFQEILLKPKIKSGIDLWWVDGWGADGRSRNEGFFKKHEGEDKMSLGTQGYEKLDPQLWINHFYYKSTKEVLAKRGLIMSRWGGIGSHRYPLQFSGDTYSTWETLAYEVFFTYTGGNILANYWSHDIGGFLGTEISKDLFIRWFQFGAFSPVMRTHSVQGSGGREPWNFDTETVKIFRKYVRIRYRLLPYFYTYAFLSYKDAIPWLRAMYHNYPGDEESYRFTHQYMIGDDILVAPVVKPLRGKEFVYKKIFFPQGEWIDIESGKVLRGRTVVTVPVPLKNIPFFIRKGAVIPVSRDMKYIGEKRNDVLRFEIFPDKESKFEYYEDDGVSDDYRKGKYTRISVKVASRRSQVTVELGAMKGSYKNLIKKRKLEIVLHLSEPLVILTARIGERLFSVKREKRILGELNSPFNSFKLSTVYRGSKAEKIRFIISGKKK